MTANQRSMLARSGCLACVLLLCVAPGVSGVAEAQEAGGVITGSILGPAAARLPGVAVTVLRDDVAVARVVTGEQGVYRVSGLGAGTYEVRAELAGFDGRSAWLTMAPGDAARLDLTLEVTAWRESVTVVGTRSRDSLEAAKIAESGARDVGEAIGAMAGVWKVRRGAIASDVLLRGYQGDNVTVLIDGVRLYGACPNNMDHAAFHVDFAEVDRIEIGKGPFDVKNQGALGGVVNIVTKRPESGVHAAAQVAFGSAGYVNPSATVSFGGVHVAALGGYSYRQSGAYRDGAGRSVLDGANYRASAAGENVFGVHTAWGRLDGSPSPHDRLLVSFTGQRAGLVLYPYLQMDALWDDADRARAGWTSSRRSGAIEALRVDAYVTRVDHWMTDQYRLTSNGAAQPFSMATMARSESRGIRAEAVMSRVTVGTEAYRRSWDAETQMAMGGYQVQHAIPDTSLTSAGAFAEYSQTFGAARVDLGGRFDRSVTSADPLEANTSLYRTYHGEQSISTADTYPTGKARVAWQLRPAVVVSGGIGRTVRVPDPQERYFGLRRSGTDWVGNPGLVPASNTGVDLALTFRPQRLYLAATVHRDSLDEFINVYSQARIGMVPGAMNSSARSYRNVPATMTGGEIEASLSLTDRLFVAADVSAVRGEQRADAARGIAAGNLAEIPPIRSRVALRYDRRGARHGVFGEIEGVYSARQGRVAADLRETPTPTYGVVSLRAGATSRRLRVTVGVGNVLDRTYVEHLSYQRDPFRSAAKVFEPGRNIYTNLAIAF